MSHAPLNDYSYSESPETIPLKQSRIISSVLSPSVRMWLRSQVEQVEDLQVKIQGGDRLILSGHVPNVSLSARRAVYQGLHLRQIQIAAQAIRINLGQILKGKPLRLLAPVPVNGELVLEETDLQASLASNLLPGALNEFLVTLLKAGGLPNSNDVLKNRQVIWQEITIDYGKIQLKGTVTDDNKSDDSFPILICTGIEIANGNYLLLTEPQIKGPFGSNVTFAKPVEINLGSDVEIEELTLTPGRLICRGRLLVRTD
ncbi:MAG TPA: DUF2993 domain-containing protein [Leptolyngbyaceae cyanobacterium]